MATIRNTATQEPIINLLKTLEKGGIEAQEARGQRELVASTQLPTDRRGCASLEKAGVKFGPPCDDDPLFCRTELPEGWKKIATDHSMWSDLVDDKGRKRARIFYKAAFYDRAAIMCVVARFSVDCDWGDDGAVARVKDGDWTIFTSDLIAPIKASAENGWQSEYDVARKQAGAWLDEHYPDWKDAAAYWDLP